MLPVTVFSRQAQGGRPLFGRVVNPPRDILHINRPRWHTLDILGSNCDRNLINVVMDDRPQGKQLLLRIRQLPRDPVTDHTHE